LSGQVSYLVDDSGQFGLEQIRQPSTQSAFRAPNAPLRTLYDSRPHWPAPQQWRRRRGRAGPVLGRPVRPGAGHLLR